MDRLTIRLLGPPEIEAAGAPLDVDTRKATALLAYIALEGAQRREALAGLLWPESTDTRARAALRRTLSVLNRALDGRWLHSARTGVDLVDDWWCDVTEFRTAARVPIGEHAAETCAQCLTRLETAAALYRGDFLAGFGLRDSAAYDEWMIVETEGLRRECSGVLERLVDALTTAGRLDDAIAQARRLVALDALHEPAHRRLMQLYAWNGRRADAVRQYRECVATLDRELGVQPLDETTALYEQIVQDRVAQRPAARTAPPVRTAPHALELASSATPATTPLVGRAAALDALCAAYEEIDADGRLLGIAGEAGIGKTRLAEELTTTLGRRGATVLTARCQHGDRQLAYAPIAEALRDAVDRPGAERWLADLPAHWRAEAARLVPQLGPADLAAAPEPLTSPGAQARFVEGVWQVLGAALDGGAVPGMLVIDDLQWADTATLQLVIYLVTRLRGRRLALLCCWRNDEVAVDDAWTATVRALVDGQMACLVTLERLDLDDTAALVAASSTHDPADVGAWAERLHTEAEGLPLAVVAYLAELDPAADHEAWPLPDSLEQLFRARVADLDAAARQVLTAAATIGRSFDFDTVVAASGRTDGETVTALEALAARGMVRELDGSTGTTLFDFTHDKLRAVVYDGASLARRRLLHRRIADALRTNSRVGDRPSALAGRIGRHEQLAGRDDRAAEEFARAGERARALYANDEALAHLRRALALGHPDAGALHEAIGDLETLRGAYRAALVSYDTAAGSAAGVHLAALEHKCAQVQLRQGDVRAAQARLDAAVAAVGDAEAPGLRARISADRSLTAERAGDVDEAELEARRALDLAERAGDRRALAQARNILGLLARRNGHLDEAERQLRQSARLASDLVEIEAQVTALNNLALVLGDAERFDAALAQALSAVDLCERIGDRHREAALHNNIADLLHAAGNEEEAMQHLTRAVTLFADVGRQAANQPEIWKLVDW